MTSPLNSRPTQLVRRWKHIDPPGLWLSVFSGSAIVHLLVLGITSRMAIESTATNPDLVAVDLVELPLENPPVSPIPPTPTPPTPTPPTIPASPTPIPNPTPSTPNPSPVFPSLSNNSPSAASPTPAVEPTPQPTPNSPENPNNSNTPAVEPSPEPTQTPSPTPQPTPAAEPTPEPNPEPTPPPTQPGEPSVEPEPSPEPTLPPNQSGEPSVAPEPNPEPTPPTQPGETPIETPGEAGGNGSEATGGNSVRITLTSVTGTAIYEGSCASSASQNFTLCPASSISISGPNGQCTGEFTISLLLDDSQSSDRGIVLGLREVRRANGENAPEPCSVWLTNLIKKDWRFQPGGTSTYFTSADIDISIAIE